METLFWGTNADNGLAGSNLRVLLQIKQNLYSYDKILPMTNPELLYRGSPNKDVSLFVPKERVGHGSSERMVVSATPDRTVATKFVVPIENLKVTTGSFGGVHYYVCGDKPAFREMDKGGAIYTLKPEDFEFNSDAGIWASPKPVETTSQEDVSSGLEAMIEADVQVFFVDTETFNKIKESPDKIREILRDLTSEKMKRNKNVRVLPS